MVAPPASQIENRNPFFCRGLVILRLITTLFEEDKKLQENVSSAKTKKKQLYVRMNFPLLTGVCSSVHALLLHAHKCEACQIKMELLNGQWRIATRDGLASIDAIPPP